MTPVSAQAAETTTTKAEETAAAPAKEEAKVGPTTGEPATETTIGEETTTAAAEEIAPTTAEDGSESETTPAPEGGVESAVVVESPEGVEAIVKALSEALESKKLLVQNVTLVLPNYNPPPQPFFDAILGGRALLRPLPQQSAGGLRYGPWTMNLLYADKLHDAGGTATSANQNYIGPLVPQPIVPSEWQHIIDVDMLSAKLRISKSIKLIDASFEPDTSMLDPDQFKEKYYGNWELLQKEKKGLQYERSHIPGAVNFNLNIATYPSWSQRQALYPEDKFQEYVRLLGINAGDELVVYSRGPLGGMMFAARVWEMFRIYGHERVSVLNGGLDAWRRAQLPTEDAEVAITPGNWKARLDRQLVVTFEELVASQSDGFCVLTRLYWYNFLDARPRSEFLGLFPNELYGATVRTRIVGSKSFPADELVRNDGLLMLPSEIAMKLQTSGYVPTKETIVYGNTPGEASMVLLALKITGNGRARLYNGGLDEITRRGPHFVSAKKRA